MPMSPHGRPKGSYRSAQHEGTPVSPPGRPKGSYRSAQHEGTPVSAAGPAVVFAYSNVGDRCLRVLHARGVEVALVVTHRDAPGETLWFRRVADTAAELGLQTVYADG